MLTIKNLTWTGLETLHMAEEVSYHPGASDDPNTYSGSVMFLDRGEWHQIHDGNVYVMNDKGATVANYRLGAPSGMTAMNAATKATVQGGLSSGAGAVMGRAA